MLTLLLILEKRQTAKLLEKQAEAHRSVMLKQVGVNSQAFAQLRAADPWQYQAIQAMNVPSQYDVNYDPSEEAEAERIAERNNTKDQLEETLNAEEYGALDDIFPGSWTA